MIPFFALVVAWFTKTPRALMAMAMMTMQSNAPTRSGRRRYRILAKRWANRVWNETRWQRRRRAWLNDPFVDFRRARHQIDGRFIASSQSDEWLARRAQREASQILAEAHRRYWWARDAYAMTTKAHTDVTLGAPANAAVINAPLGQLDSAFSDVEAVVGDYVVTGGLAGTSASLLISVPALRAFVLNTYVQVATSPLTVTLNQDTYVDVDSSGVLHMSGVANGAATPAVFANSIRLFKAVSGATAVTSVVDLRSGAKLALNNIRYIAPSGADDGPGLQTLVNTLSAAGGGAIVATPGAYIGNTAVNWKSNVSLWAYPRTATFKCTTVNGQILQNVTGALDGVTIFGLNFDMTAVGWSAIAFTGSDAAGQVTNLTIRDCQFKNPSSTWMIQVSYLIVDPTVPASKNQNIKIEDCRDDATGQTGTLENIIIINCQDVLIQGNTLINAPSPLGSHLSIYAYNRNVRVVSNYFSGWNANRALYVVQCDTVKFIGNEFRTTNNKTTVQIYNSKDIEASDNDMVTGSTGVGVNIKDFTGTTFDAHTNIYSATQNVRIHHNRMDVMATCVQLDVSSTQGQSDIFVEANQMSPLRNAFFLTGMPAAPNATVQRITIRGNHISSHSAISPDGCIDIVGNAAAANGGVQTVVIADNVIPSGGGSSADITVRNLADDVFIEGNRCLSPIQIKVDAACTHVRIQNNPGAELQSPAFAASFTPDLSAGQTIRIAALTAAITINLPTPISQVGQEVEFMFVQDGTGGRAVSWNGSYITSWTNVGNTLSLRSSIRFRCVPGNVWEQVSAQRVWA